MTKIVSLLLLFMLCSVAGHTQNIYSKQNLEQASLEELNVYLKTSQKLKKTGVVLSITGPVTIIAGAIVFAATWDDDAFIGYTTGSDIGGWMIVAGMVTTLVGVPTLITGASRVKKITRIMYRNPVSFEIAPCRFQEYMSKNNQLGATLRIRF